MRSMLLAGAAVSIVAVTAFAEEPQRNFAGSVQLDYLAVPTEDVGRETSLDGATVELSLKLAMDFNENVSSNVKLCVACHGMEVGMAFFDARVADELNFRVGRFTPSFGNFPLRHDPANHRTSDKPLPYDMGRMLRIEEWNMSVLPAPWVDNGIEIGGTRFYGDASRFDYAVYAVGGPKGSDDAVDFDYKQSRSRERYYVDNNSRPAVGAHIGGSLEITDSLVLSSGVSGMAGHYDPHNDLSFWVVGGHLVLQYERAVFRSEYLLRRTEMYTGDNPETRFKYGPGENGAYDNFFLKDGFYAEVEVPVGNFDLIARWDGLRRFGNVLASSTLRSRSALLRYTAGMAYRMRTGLRLKTSFEIYDFSDYEDELALHMGIAGPF